MPDNQISWSEVPLEENIMTPPEILAKSEDAEEQRPQRRSHGGFWNARTGLEKGLLVALGVCGVVLMAGGSFYALKNRNSPNGIDGKETIFGQDEDVCITEACTTAAANIISSMDQTADPCQNFYQFSCGGWIANNEIPEGKSRWGKFYELRDAVDKAVRKIVESPEAEGDPKSVGYLKDHYNACRNTTAIEEVGLEPFLELARGSSQFGGWPMVQNAWNESLFSLERAIGAARRRLNSAFVVTAFVYLDDFDVSHNVIYLDQPDLALPRDMYLDTDNFGKYIEAYKTFMFETALAITRGLGENVSEERLKESVQHVVEFETWLARFSVPEEDRRNTTEMYNPYTFASLAEKYPINWAGYFEEVFKDTSVTINNEEKIIVREPEFFDALLPVLIATPENVQADYVFWRALMSLADEGPAELVDAAFKFTSTLQGTSEPLPRWNKCVSKASSEYTGFGMAVGHKYILDYFDEAAKDRADTLVDNMIFAFKELVGESAWMDADTQVKAKEKADAIVSLLGYPDFLEDAVEVDNYFSGIREPTLQTHLSNIVGVKEWVSKKELESLRKTPARDEWITVPAIVNAFYSPNHNSISFPAGILQPPFFAFAPSYPRYLNYGAIGVVIGHEITHGFDDQGRQYDGNGNAQPWWSDETIQAFTDKAQCFIDQYGNYTVNELIPDLGNNSHVNGKNTQGENIADNGGVRESFRAYQISIENQGQEPRLPGLTQYSPEQMFFISYAQVWCEKVTTSGLLNQILTDPHSPGKFRVFGPLSNSDDFAREFSCPIGPMNREDKCILW